VDWAVGCGVNMIGSLVTMLDRLHTEAGELGHCEIEQLLSRETCGSNPAGAGKTCGTGAWFAHRRRFALRRWFFKVPFRTLTRRP
jgi:hypothetical protein